MKNINWKDHLISLLVVILGISIAYSLEGWRESRKEKVLETAYLKALQEDLQNDFDQLDTLLKVDLSRMTMLNRLAEVTYNPAASRDSLGYYIRFLIFHQSFEPQRAAYEAITSSGNLNLISDFELRGRLIELYSQWYRGSGQYDEAVMEFTNQFMRPFTIYNVEFLSGIDVKKDFIDKSSFKNMIFSYQAVFEARLNFQKDLLRELEELIRQLDEVA